MARSLNKVTLIGNLTRDPELRYTPQGTAVCTFGLATNRQWTTDTGEKKEDVEFHRIVAWQKLAELCSQLLTKGRKVYLEGRLQTRKWTGQDEVERTTTEIVINEMIILDSRGAVAASEGVAFDHDQIDKAITDAPIESVQKESSLKQGGSGGGVKSTTGDKKGAKKPNKASKKKKTGSETIEEGEEDIPF